MEHKENLAKKIIVALDVDTEEEALRLTEQLPESEVFKVGLNLFTAKGPSLFEKLASTHAQLVHPGSAGLLRDAPGPMPRT